MRRPTRGRRWDDVGQVPWYRYVSSTTYDTWVQGYYDDSRSLEVKYDLVKAHDLRGIGIWHLLMDGSRRELWNRWRRSSSVRPSPTSPARRSCDDIIWVADTGITDRLRAEPVLPHRPGHARSDGERSWPARWTCRRPRPITSPTTTAPPTRTTSTASRRPASPPAAATPTSAPTDAVTPRPAGQLPGARPGPAGDQHRLLHR